MGRRPMAALPLKLLTVVQPLATVAPVVLRPSRWCWWSGQGGTGDGGAGGTGGVGGAGGSIALDAGTFNMSNSMSSVGQSAAGIMVAAQNSGMNAMVQQAVTVQANLNVGRQ